MNRKIETIREGFSPRTRSSLAMMHVNLRDALAVWRRTVEVHLRLWKLNLIAPAIEPVFSVLAFGWGLGALVAGKVSGISYLSFVGAGILGLTVLMRAMFETTYAAYFRMVYQSTYDAILATPVDAESLAFAEILWAITHAAMDTLIILIVLVAFGGGNFPVDRAGCDTLTRGKRFYRGPVTGIHGAHSRHRCFQHLHGRVLYRHAYLRRVVSGGRTASLAALDCLRDSPD